MLSCYSKDDREATLLAAILHDIGKFEQRGQSQHRKHEFFGGDLVLQAMSKLWEKTANIVRAHHNPREYAQGERLAQIVSLADWLAASEREESGDKENPESVEAARLHSIFSSIAVGDKCASLRDDPAKFPLEPLSLSLTNCFPKESTSAQEPHKLKEQYSALWERFRSEFTTIKFDNPFDIIFSQVMGLLEKYTVFVPSAAYYSKPDISLFVHLKATAALTACILSTVPDHKVDEYYKAIRSASGNQLLDDPIAKLLLCDISGIQSFIYSTPSRGALKELKGRSAYLQILSQDMADTILSRYDLPAACIVFIGGGNFSLLLPAGADTARLRREFSEQLMEKHGGDLSTVIESVDITWNDFRSGRISSRWHEVGKKVGLGKRKKGQEQLSDKVQSAFFMMPAEKEWHPDEENPFHTISKQFTNAKFIYVNERIDDSVDVLNSRWYFSREEKSTFRGLCLNQYDFLKHNSRGFRTIANHAALSASGFSAATLEELADACKSGKKTWGIFRADVDNLGTMFRDGLRGTRGDAGRPVDDKLVTFSRIGTLSHMLSLFFSGHIQSVACSPEFTDKVNIVYSGGDDLFVLGSWDVLPDFAIRVRQDFSDFVARDDITFSASIFLAPAAKYPIAHAAQLSGEMLESAKAAGKNRICFIDHTALTWDRFEKLRAVKNEIRKFVREGEAREKGARSLIRILADSVAMSKVDRNEISLTHIYRLVYSLKRWAKRYATKDNMHEELRECFITDNRLDPDLRYAVRWAEFETREESVYESIQ